MGKRSNGLEKTVNYKDKISIKLFYCKDCDKQISTYSGKYGQRRCHSCAKIGKNNPNWRGGKPKKKYFCKDCGKQISLSSGAYGKGRCRSCSVKLKHKKGLYGRGKNHPSWKGGRIKINGGYILIHSPNHPNRAGNYVLGHRLVMEKHLGRYLTKEEIVHHKNEIRGDNRFKNLQLCSNNAEHRKLHNKKGGNK